MQTLAKRLPPLDALVAFEAAARLGSFTLAANELYISQAAVSQRIKQLEEAVGLELFKREHRSISLNQSGREYQHTVAMALNHLAGATEVIEKSEDRETLVVSCDQAIGHLWLLPRMQQLVLSGKKASIRMIVSDDLDKCLSIEVDVAFVFGGSDAPGFAVERLFQERVFPVCAPSYLGENGPINNPEELFNGNLIELEDDRWDWMNWNIWINQKFNQTPPAKRRFQVGSYPLVIDAACRGFGIALGWGGLVDELLQTGELVRPIDAAYETDNGYNILKNQHSQIPEIRDQFVSSVLQSHETG